MERKSIAKLLIGIVIVAIVGIIGFYSYENMYFVQTEDAIITGDIYKAVPKMSGEIVKVYVEEGQIVEKDEILMELEKQNMINIEDTYIRAPISGTIIQKKGMEGEVVGAGTSVAMIVSKPDLYVEANIEETKAGSIHEGQMVDITIDMYPDHTFKGKVEEVGQATKSVFSLLPAMNAGGSFTKITQRIPVKISFQDGPYDFKPGLNAVAKIHIK